MLERKFKRERGERVRDCKSEREKEKESERAGERERKSKQRLKRLKRD